MYLLWFKKPCKPLLPKIESYEVKPVAGFDIFNSSSTRKTEKLDFWDLTSITREPHVQSLSTWLSLENLSKTSLWRQCSDLPFSRYCCSKVGWYYEPPNGAKEAKGLRPCWKNISRGKWILHWFPIFFFLFLRFSQYFF